jgi:hypothetical protein
MLERKPPVELNTPATFYPFSLPPSVRLSPELDQAPGHPNPLDILMPLFLSLSLHEDYLIKVDQ